MFRYAVLLFLILGSSICFGENCPCTISKSWNDIFLVFDGSNALRPTKFDQLINYFFHVASKLTVGQAQQYESRVGIITFGDQANLTAGLDKYNSSQALIADSDKVITEHLNTLCEDYQVCIAFNPKSAYKTRHVIKVANDAYKGSTHRPGSRKVLIIGASTYRKGNYGDPLVEAYTFMDNGGIIIILALDDRHAVAELQQLASPGYFIDANNGFPTTEQLTDLLCSVADHELLTASANCFCPSPYSPLSNSARGEPTDGCFSVFNLPYEYVLAKARCADASSGTLSVVPTPAQQVFITRYQPTNTPVYVGLERSANGQWTWADGTLFNSTIKDGGDDCGTVTRVNGFTTQFATMQCISQQIASCQVTPCSTDFPCSSVFLN